MLLSGSSVTDRPNVYSTTEGDCIWTDLEELYICLERLARADLPESEHARLQAALQALAADAKGVVNNLVLPSSFSFSFPSCKPQCQRLPISPCFDRCLLRCSKVVFLQVQGSRRLPEVPWRAMAMRVSRHSKQLIRAAVPLRHHRTLWRRRQLADGLQMKQQVV